MDFNCILDTEMQLVFAASLLGSKSG